MEHEARAFDIVIWGATGFTGRLVAEYMSAAAPASLAWALGGRDLKKLEAVRAALPERGRNVPIVVHDAASETAMAELAKRTRVVCTTVGPYGRYGMPLVRACAAHGTDYCDLTGEVPFMRRSIDECHEVARRSGARIVHTCGFDSIPSDLGVFLLSAASSAPLSEVRMVLTESHGGTSGGTLASALDLVDAARSDRAVRRLIANPHALDPEPTNGRKRGPRRFPIEWDGGVGRFVGPFPMEAVNVRVVHRSNALFSHRYGHDLDYRETMVVGRPLKGLPGAVGLVLGMAGFVAAASVPPTRRILEAKLPKPGEGPSERTRKRGFFKFTLFATPEGDSRPRFVARVEGTQDPGYGETSKMIGESALCLALDPRVPGFEGGVLTPATALGMSLVERLRKAGMTFEVSASS